jgi:hypothetical protein
MPYHHFLPFVDSDSNLDLATSAILDTAYDRALAELHDRGPDSVRQAIARRIICSHATRRGGSLPTLLSCQWCRAIS